MPTIETSAAPTTTLHYVDLGRGRPVVLIHGWPLSHRMWESQIFALTAAGYRVIAYDRRGFGQSGQPAGGYDYDTFASDLNDLMAALDLRDAVLAGFSMGGGEVARYLARYGEGRVRKAMLLGAVPPFLLKTDDNPHGAPQALFDGMIAAITKDRIAFLDEFFPNFYNWDENAKKASADLIPFSKWIAWGASPLGTRDCVTAFGTTDFRKDLEKITIPVLVAHGDEDRIVPIDISGKLSAKMLKNATYEVVKGAPHGFAATHAAALNEVMLDFVREGAGARGDR